MSATSTTSRPAHPPRLIAVGGSAGAFDGVHRLLGAVQEALTATGSPGPQPTVVIVLHLPAGRSSALAEVFSSLAGRPVREVEDKAHLEPAIFVAPPDYHTLVDRCGEAPCFALSCDPPVHHSRPAIDVLFESAADVLGAEVLGILLSGANEDGARGLAAIARAGGRAWVQDPAEATSPVMPEAGRRASRTSAVMKVDAMARALGALLRSSETMPQAAGGPS